MKDALLVGGMILTSTTIATIHVAIVLGLAVRDPRWRAIVALVVPPLAPYWALQNGMLKRGIVWIGSVVLYSSLLGVSAIG
ncbi:MAG: hypothetical protein ABW133_12340 [Polyangiaceae bacterium]